MAHERAPRVVASEAALAAGVLALAGVVAWQTLEIPVSPIYARVGPTLAPWMTAAGLAAVGALLLVEALRGGWRSEEARAEPADGRALAWVVAGLVANVALIGPAGFSLASMALFALAARGFGSRRPLRDAAIGLAFALTAYLGFARTLGVNIGAGPLETALERLFGVG
jgi:putative tricarboxylic transport membrane protein